MTDPKTPPAAANLLDALVEKRLLELEEGSDSSLLIVGIERLLAAHNDPAERASALATWLLEQHAVAELYASDDELCQILESP